MHLANGQMESGAKLPVIYLLSSPFRFRLGCPKAKNVATFRAHLHLVALFVSLKVGARVCSLPAAVWPD